MYVMFIALWRCFSSTVITLYLLEENTSLLVLVPIAIGTVIEVLYTIGHCLVLLIVILFVVLEDEKSP